MHLFALCLSHTSRQCDTIVLFIYLFFGTDPFIKLHRGFGILQNTPLKIIHIGLSISRALLSKVYRAWEVFPSSFSQFAKSTKVVGRRIPDLQHLFEEALWMVGRWRTRRGCHYKTFRGRLTKLAPGLRHLFTEEWSDVTVLFPQCILAPLCFGKSWFTLNTLVLLCPGFYTFLSNPRAFHRNAELFYFSCLLSFPLNLISSLRRLSHRIFYNKR